MPKETLKKFKFKLAADFEFANLVIEVVKKHMHSSYNESLKDKLASLYRDYHFDSIQTISTLKDCKNYKVGTIVKLCTYPNELFAVCKVGKQYSLMCLSTNKIGDTDNTVAKVLQVYIQA